MTLRDRGKEEREGMLEGKIYTKVVKVGKQGKRKREKLWRKEREGTRRGLQMIEVG